MTRDQLKREGRRGGIERRAITQHKIEHPHQVKCIQAKYATTQEGFYLREPYVTMRFNHHAPATSLQFNHGSPGKGCFGSEGGIGMCRSRGLPIRTW